MIGSSQWESRQAEVGAALSSFGKLVTQGVKLNGRHIHREGRSLGPHSVISFPSPPSRGEEGFFSLISLDRMCHSVSA